MAGPQQHNFPRLGGEGSGRSVRLANWAVIGIFLIAKIIEFIFQRAETHAYWAILGLILASPVAILLKTDWSGFSVVAIITGAVTFAIGWFIASKLGDE